MARYFFGSYTEGIFFLTCTCVLLSINTRRLHVTLEFESSVQNVSCDSSGAGNLEVAPRFSEGVWARGLVPSEYM